MCLAQQPSHSNLKLLPAVLLAELVPADSSASKGAMMHFTMMFKAADNAGGPACLSALITLRRCLWL